MRFTARTRPIIRFAWQILAVVLLVAAPLRAADAPEKTASKYRIQILDQPDVSDLRNIKLHFRIVDEQGNPPDDLPDEVLTIYEDGQPVESFRPVGLVRSPMTTMLVIDTSGSMERHEKMTKAKQAAGHFFDTLDPKTPCGLILFHHQPYEIHPPTLEKSALRTLVAAANAKGGTAFLDATYQAIQLLTAEKDNRQQAVVLMTDGRDVNSMHSLREVIQEAKAKKVQIYTLGLGEPGRNDAVRTMLVLDRSGSMREGNKFPCLKRAASRFVELMPPEAADAFILAFDHHVPHQDPERPTRDKELLFKTIKNLDIGGGTALYDALYDAVETLNASRHIPTGRNLVRKVVVCLTDGKDTNSHRYRETDVIQLAQRSEIRIFMLGLGEGEELDEKVMRKIAGETGGEYHHVVQPDALTEIFEELSIAIHDDGIDEPSLKSLAQETGGNYHHVQNASELAVNFEAVAKTIQSSYPVTFRSRRSVHDGTTRGLMIKFGDVAVSQTGYRTHGFITPRSHHVLYLGLLAAILLLLAVPLWLRRLSRRPSPAA